MIEPGGERPGLTPMWILPFGVLAGLTMGALFGVVSSSVFLDFLAWWPVWVTLAVLAFLARGRRIGRLRASGLVPLIGLVAVVLFTVGHFQGWAMMPSASGRLVGPEPGGFETARLVAHSTGKVEVVGGADFLYVVLPVRWGGDIGVPDSVEEVEGDFVTVTLVDPDKAEYQTFAGWDIELSTGPVWELDLAGAIEADLRGLDLNSVALSGSGEVELGGTVGPTGVVVDGVFTVVVPADVAAKVIGQAEVPSGWAAVDGGWASPTPGDGWVIEVASGATVVIVNP